MTDGSIQTTMPVAPAGYGSSFGGGLGDFGGIGGILVLFILFAFMGNGWGGNNRGGSTSDLALMMALNGSRGGTVEGYTQSNDFSNLERENDIIRQDICQNFATLNGTLSNNFATLMDAVHSGFAASELSQSNQTAAIMGQMYNQNLTALQQSCDVSRQIGDGFNALGYNMAQQSCETRNLMQSNTRDIVESQNAGTRAILDALTAQRIEEKDSKIADLTAQLNNANLRASQAAQTNAIQDYVGNQFAVYNPRPVPSFPVPAPFQYSGCNCGNGNYM